jgi:hypothetical protein
MKPALNLILNLKTPTLPLKGGRECVRGQFEVVRGQFEVKFEVHGHEA